MDIRQVHPGDLEAATVLKGLTDEYENRYGTGDEMASVDHHEFEPPDGAFLVIVEHSVTVAGGALRRLSLDTCEVKRMWTAPAYRRMGYASAVLNALEDIARTRGYCVLRLETGPAQPEARLFYEGRGYRQIPTYGRYEEATAFEQVLS